MRITTWNVNGQRAAVRKGFRRFVARIKPDVLLLQEIRCTPDQLERKEARPRGWRVHWNPADRKGYAGTAIWSRHPVELLSTGMDGHDDQGRITLVRTAGLVVGSIYLPSGSAGEERQAAKEAWMARFLPWAAELAARDEPVVIGGDLNIAHTKADIHNATGNKRNSGFLPHERAWFGELLATGWTDMQRAVVGEVQGPYSWWSNRGAAREKDRGWRIDYLLGNAAAAACLQGADTLRRGGLVVSDHAPVSVELDLPVV
jgi:exodeoxyribonuclease III